MARRDNSQNEDSRPYQKRDPLVSIIQPGGMSTDTSLVTQPNGSTRFVLNGVNETNEGDLGFLAVEESNEAYINLPAGFIPLGSVYIGEQETLLFLCSSAGNSIIAIADRLGNLEIVVDDSNQTTKLGFKINKQIEATYRLRRGCERTIYWIDPKPRTIVLEKLEEFKDQQTGEWDFTKFNLFKTYTKIPNFSNLDVLNSGGVLLSGSYNFSIQYLDENLNPTEFVTSSAPVRVYVDDLETVYKEIEGSSSLDSSYFIPTPTTKSIRITIQNVDTSFPFYRLAIIESTGGTGIVTDTKITEPIAINIDTFTYTGQNFVSSITAEEITTFNLVIETANSITQVENKLLLADVTGSPINLCSLQKYASKIKADCVTKTTILNNLQGANPKNPESAFAGLGYMPGEIYSFGIVWVFADGTLSPAYHIPGKSETVVGNITFSSNREDETFYPMSNDNLSETNMYTDNNTCESGDYWGVDSEGTALLNSVVRHHRFPLRSAINKPLYSKELISSVDTELYAMRVQISGSITLPVFCLPPEDPAYDPDCVTPTDDMLEDILLTLTYTLNGVSETTDFNINYETWDGDATIGQEEYLGPFLDYQPLLVAGSLIELNVNGTLTTLSLTEGPVGTWIATSGVTDLTYKIVIEPWIDNQEKNFYYTETLGINFSNISKPDLVDTNGVEVTGYYIVRQDRVEQEKTILDSGVLLPTLQNKHFVSHGLLLPDLPSNTDPRIKKDFLALINPEFKFNDKIYTNFTSVLLEGKYNQGNPEYSRSITPNVLDGTTYNSKRHKKSERDTDGWDLQIRTRDSELTFESQSGVLFNQSEIKDVFYLDALSYKTSDDSADISKDVYNISSDNKIGIISLNQDYTGPIINSLPYVVLKRENANPYSNFRTTSFYKESKDVHYFNGSTSDSSIYNGDTYVSPMKYVSSVQYELRVRKRRTKSGLFSKILGAFIIVVGVALAVFTGGSSLVGAIALASAIGAASISGGGLLLASGIKQDNWNNVYNEMYEKGLKETLEDDFLKTYFKDVNPSDDEIRWFGDAVTNLWFESSVNIGLRQSANVGSIPSFIPAPAFVETGNGVNGGKDPSTELDRHLLSKLTVLNSEREQSGKEFIGLALPELYDINPDFYRANREKIFNHLGLEYDCCSDCFEKFPHRIMYSEQSFQEELTDNFRNFLTNNYKDIEGETGRIVDMFRIQNNLYIHTEEALWHLPQNLQERVTGDIISFIGTGEYFNIPPRKILDASDSSAGTSHKWGRTKTKNGIVFPCHREGKWYLFNGKDLKAISDVNMSSEFRKGMRFLLDEQHFENTGEQYKFSDNPSNSIGTGYISTFDTKKERLLVTKKDIAITNLPTSDYQLCTSGANVTIFNTISQTIATQEALGYTYRGIDECRLKFTKEVLTPTVEIRQRLVETLPSDVHVYVVLDSTGSFSVTDRDDIIAAVTEWYEATRPEDIGNTKLHIATDGTERYLSAFTTIVANATDMGIHGGRVLYLNFTNESQGSDISNYQSSGEVIDPVTGQPTTAYSSEYNNFVTTLYPQFSFLKVMLYPITTDGWYPNGRAYIQHVLLALKGISYTSEEVALIPQNPAFDGTQFATLLSSLQSANPYATLGNGLDQYGFQAQVDRSDIGQVVGEPLIAPALFASDLNALLASGTLPGESTYEDYEVTVLIPSTETIFIPGTPFVPVTIESSSTLSYSMKFNTWTSYHSYLPHFYFFVQDKFFSWKNGLASLYKHNKKGSYRTFYGVEYPFIIEVIDNPQVLSSKITDGFLFQTEARKYDTESEEFYDMEDVTFNKVLAYNTRQISGWKDLIFKDETTIYLLNQIKNSNTNIFIDRNERDWTINELRDYSSNSNVPLFKKDLVSLQADYFIDKIVNPSAVNENKDWTQLESFRDKFLVVRLVFDTFTDVNLLMNFMSGDKKNSER